MINLLFLNPLRHVDVSFIIRTGLSRFKSSRRLKLTFGDDIEFGEPKSFIQRKTSFEESHVLIFGNKVLIVFGLWRY